MSTRKIQILGSMLKQAENADTLDGKHADEFAAASDVEALKSQVGDISVSEQIDIAVANKIDKVAGVTGNIVVFGKDGTIADSGKTADTIYVVPYYSHTSITEQQKAEIVNIVNEIKADKGDYALFMKVGQFVIPASIEVTRNTIVRATIHNDDNMSYEIVVSRNGEVTVSQKTIYIMDQEKIESASTQAVVGSVMAGYVQDYVAEHGGVHEGDIPVTSVNGKIGDVNLSAEDVGALPSDTKIPTKLSELEADKNHRTVTDSEREAWSRKSDFSGKYSDLEGKPVKLSDFENDEGYITEIDVPVKSVNGKTGAVVLDATDVGALSADITKLPNPYAITFTGAATGTYDGSGALEIHIPEGGDKVPTDDEALELVIEMGLVDPIASDDGAIYIDENNMIYTL